MPQESERLAEARTAVSAAPLSALDAGSVPHPLVIVGPFQPAALAHLLPREAAARLAGLENFAGVPINWLADAFVRNGIRATLIGGIRGAEPRVIESDPLSVITYKSSGGWPFLLNGRRRERDEILSRLRAIQPRVVHAHWTLEAGRAVGDWHGPKVLTVHDAAWEYARLGWSAHPIGVAYGARWLANTSATLARYKHLIAVSPFLEGYLRLRHRFAGEIRVIPNAIPELPKGLDVPSSFPKTGAITFACYGDRGRLKNIDTAIRAFQLLSKRLPDARLMVFGSGWDGEKKELGQGSRITFSGGLPHAEFLRCLVQEVDVWLHPSLMETHGIVLCEALQAGCPVVAGRESGAVPGTLDYGRSGYLVDVRNMGEFADAMWMAVEDRKRSSETVAHGQQFIRENFSPERVLALHLNYYKDIAAG